MTPISASDVASALMSIPTRHVDTVLAKLAQLSPGAATSVREHVEAARSKKKGELEFTGSVSAEANRAGRLQLASKSRRLPDRTTDAICEALTGSKRPIGFNDIYEKVHASLVAQGAASAGEEALRLRTYEKLQNMVTRGTAHKCGKDYQATETTVQATSAWIAEHA